MKRAWAACVLAVGLACVGAVYACVRAAMPDRVADLAVYAPVLFGPYLLAAVGCWQATTRFVRLAAGLVIGCGLLLTATAVFDAWPTFSDGPPPAMPAFALLGGVLLLGQLVAGLAAAVGGWVGSSSPLPAVRERGRG